MPVEFDLERRNQFPVLLVDGTPAVEMIIVFRNGEHPFGRYILPPQDILEEGHDFIFGFGSTERNHQQGVIRHRS